MYLYACVIPWGVINKKYHITRMNEHHNLSQPVSTKLPVMLIFRSDCQGSRWRIQSSLWTFKCRNLGWTPKPPTGHAGTTRSKLQAVQTFTNKPPSLQGKPLMQMQFGGRGVVKIISFLTAILIAIPSQVASLLCGE